MLRSECRPVMVRTGGPSWRPGLEQLVWSDPVNLTLLNPDSEFCNFLCEDLIVCYFMSLFSSSAHRSNWLFSNVLHRRSWTGLDGNIRQWRQQYEYD